MVPSFGNDPLPIDEILQGSVFYPASAMDGRPVKYLAGFSHSSLAHAERWYEVPLDKVATMKIRAAAPAPLQPRWRGIKYLTPAVNAEYQAAARRVARAHGVAPVHLDAWFWGGPRDDAA